MTHYISFLLKEELRYAPISPWEHFREFPTMQGRINLMNRLFRESYTPEAPEEALTTLFNG